MRVRAVLQPDRRKLFVPKAQIASILHLLANPLERPPARRLTAYQFVTGRVRVTLRNQTSIQKERAPPLNRETPQITSFQNLSHFVEEAIVARDWLE